MALLTSLLTPCLHLSSELAAVRRPPLLRARAHAVCKLDVDTANAFSCMGFNIGRQVRAGYRPCPTPHPSPAPGVRCQVPGASYTLSVGAGYRAALQPDPVPPHLGLAHLVQRSS